MKITIPKPCHENWAAMTPEEKGRFCQVCSKSVRDFTNASDQEIIDDLFQNPNICANFRVDQLDRNLSYSFLNSLFVKFAVGFVLTSGGLVAAQTQAQPHHRVKANAITKVTGEIVVAKVPKKPVKIDKNSPFILGKIASTGVERADAPVNNTSTQQIRIGAAASSSNENSQPLFIVDGKIITDEQFRQINSKTIETVKVLKGKDAISKYGAKAKNGVVIITLKGKKTK